MNEPQWIDIDALEDGLNMMDCIPASGLIIRDRNLLESAIAKSRNLYEYQGCDCLFDLAAAYGFGIAKNHPYVDGNKRAAFCAVRLFLYLNQYQFSTDESELIQVFVDLASNKITQDQFSHWLSQNTKPISL